MILSPPFLPTLDADFIKNAGPDPLMDAVDQYELGHSGIYPIAFDGRWHCGTHLNPRKYVPVHAIADGEVVAYSVRQKAISCHRKNHEGTEHLDSNTGFVLLRHTTETGEGRVMTFYSLYMHLLDLDNTRNRVKPMLKMPPEVGSATVLPKWLSYPTDGVQVPANLKVNRKDILGYPGMCQGQPHIHFEIFMTEADFAAWFEPSTHPIQLGIQSPTTPVSKDYWGHSYFVIPGGQTFISRPPVQKAHAHLFPELQAGALCENSRLYVEAYFHKGQRYTRSWLEKDGKITCLTGPNPVTDPCQDYEYELYSRATTLYPDCPSDGYELLRFGRILSDEPKLPNDARKTWVSVTFEAGKQGYIDINQSAIQKLSDADFPRFMGWQKIAEGNTPFSDDVLCDLDKLKKIVRYVDERDDPAARLRPGFEREDRLAIYIRENPEVLAELRGFICHAPSEWDASLNDVRYRRLNDPDGFYGRRKETDPDGYDRFIRFLTQLQFLDKTPLGTGKKFWFFHPLAFIRHFRRCGWLADSEMKNTAPATALRRAGSRWVSEPVLLAPRVIDRFGAELNKAMRKFGIQTPLRQAAFLGNALQETQWFWRLEEDGGEGQRYSPWFGRGFLQLTWPDNYIKYWRFLGRDIDQAVVNRLRAAADKAHRERNNAALMAAEKHLPPEIGEWRRWVAGRPVDAADSAGAYWAWSKAAVPADQYPRFQREIRRVGNLQMPYYSSDSFGRVAATVNVGHASSRFSLINGIEARFQAYAAALFTLADGIRISSLDGHPDGGGDL